MNTNAAGKEFQPSGELAVGHQSAHTWQVVAAFAFGVIFLTAILVIALFIKEPTPLQYQVFWVIVALAAAGVGGILPGFVDFRYKDIARAGGALALFLIVYFEGPTALQPLVPKPVIETPAGDPELAARGWLALVDSHKLDVAYSEMSQSLKSQVTSQAFEHLSGRYLGNIGALVTRELVYTDKQLSPPGAPPGDYRIFVFDSRYADEPQPVLLQITLVGESGRWRAFGFHVMMKNSSGVLVPFEPTASMPH